MLLAKKDVIVENVQVGEGMAKVLKLGVKRKGGKSDFVVVYIPPKE